MSLPVPWSLHAERPIPMRIIAAGRSDVGLQRDHNEDSWSCLPGFGLYLVAD